MTKNSADRDISVTQMSQSLLNQSKLFFQSKLFILSLRGVIVLSWVKTMQYPCQTLKQLTIFQKLL